MDFSPTTSDAETVNAFASCEGDIVKTALALSIPERIVLARIVRISRKASLGYRQRKELRPLAIKLQTWLKEALEMAQFIADFKKSKNTS